MGRIEDRLGVTTVEGDPTACDQTSDEMLAHAVRLGDNLAFEEIFIRHRLRVVRIASRFFNLPEKVEEIVQDTFTKAYFSIESYSNDRGSSFAAWISRIAINSCYDELRRARRRRETPINTLAGDKPALQNARSRGGGGRDAESELVSRDLASKLLARLKPEDRLVLTLLDAEEMPVAQIAAALGWSVSKVKVRAHRARAALRRFLKELL